ncbi:hypothetical protein X801_03443 [Opisthorchis viverrini]|uniref:FCP1 homology domain-containing protein n=1 Tax=Opisthorchis viverrini TaxID=6198 RepID=A0A1S8X224_OPIVI|nr:hypothetical protein X801_03443 [Opisthorchis viverrini]
MTTPKQTQVLLPISQWYELVIYTASLEIYGAGVTEHLDNGRRILQRRFYRQADVFVHVRPTGIKNRQKDSVRPTVSH